MTFFQHLIFHWYPKLFFYVWAPIQKYLPKTNSMITDRDYKTQSKNAQIVVDAKEYLSLHLGTQEYNSLRNLVCQMCSVHADTNAAEGHMWKVHAELLYNTRMADFPSDFIPYKMDGQGQGEWTNTASPWPPIGIYREGKCFDPFGIRQCDLANTTIRERNDSIRHIYASLNTAVPFYISEAPYYSWLENVDAVSNIVQQQPCDEKNCKCRNFHKLGSIVKIFCRALNRQDLCDKYSIAFTIHGGNVVDGSVVEIPKHPKRKKQSVAPKIKALSQEIQDEIRVFSDRSLQASYGAMLSTPIGIFDEYFDDYMSKTADQRRFFRRVIRTIMESATEYLIIAFMYNAEMRPLRNDLVNLRYWSEGLDTERYASIKVTDTECVIDIPKTTKKYDSFRSENMAGGQLHKFLQVFRPYAESVQENVISTRDNCIKSPYMLCSYDHTRTYIDESERTPNKCMIGTAPWRGLVNFRPKMFRRAGIIVPKGHTGCIAARHSSTTNDAIANAKILDPKEKHAAKMQQARERNHGASTAEVCYEDVQESSPKTKKSKITVVEI